MTQEMKNYLLKGHVFGKHFIERVVTISIKESDHNKILLEASENLKRQWPSIKDVTWEAL